MRLKVWVPTDVFLDEAVVKIKAEAENGWFCILPRHIDFVTSLVPGILSFQVAGRNPEYVAIDRGILLKCGPEVSVSVRHAVRGADLGALKDAVEKQFRVLREKEQAARVFEAKLEAELVRQLIQVDKHA
ncbi:MAG TPA: F0F1 ATP synthase subunit epsilon [Bryobacteraceae bacterium]|nr:F0F1 ATP synthase subunit epsilon [Bryobacteraceae bacterium]